MCEYVLKPRISTTIQLSKPGNEYRGSPIVSFIDLILPIVFCSKKKTWKKFWWGVWSGMSPRSCVVLSCLFSFLQPGTVLQYGCVPCVLDFWRSPTIYFVEGPWILLFSFSFSCFFMSRFNLYIWGKNTAYLMQCCDALPGASPQEVLPMFRLQVMLVLITWLKLYPSGFCKKVTMLSSL